MSYFETSQQFFKVDVISLISLVGDQAQGGLGACSTGPASEYLSKTASV